MISDPSCKFCGLQQNDPCVTAPPLPPSLLNPLLDSNIPLMFHEKMLVRSYLSRIQAGLDALDAAAEKLRQVRVELEKEKSKHVALISPLRPLPHEILSQIFLLCTENWWKSVNELESRKELDAWHKAEGLITAKRKKLADFRLRPVRALSQVCRSWRAVAFGSPRIWSYVYLPGPTTEGEIAANQRLLSDQLARSLTQPLRILTHSTQSLAPRLEDVYHSLLCQHIFPTHRRWSSIDIISTGDIPILFPSPYQASPAFPSLVSLSIIFLDSDYDYEWTLSAEDVPLLTEASLTWTDLASHGAEFQLPWAQLRSLRLSGCEGVRALAILQRLRDVEEFELCGKDDIWDESFDSWQEPVTLPSLRCLRISSLGHDESDAAKILPYLRLPALKTLSWTQMGSEDSASLVSMINQTWPRGGCTLEELFLRSPQSTMHDFTLPDRSLTQLLELICSSLKVISIEYSSPSQFDLSYLVALLVRFLRENTTPHLCAVKLRGVFLDTWYIKELLPYIRKRDIDVEFSKCALDHMELFEDNELFINLYTLRTYSPDRGRLKLDIEGPDSKHIVYSSQFGLRIEEK